MKRKKLIKRIAIILGILIIIAAILTVITGKIVFDNSSNIAENDPLFVEHVTMGYYADIGFDYADFQELYNIQEVEIASTFGDHTIPGKLIYSDTADNDTVIVIHGLGGNHMEILPRTAILLENGFNALVCDQRSSGGNFAKHNTFGYWESYDAADCVTYLDGIIGKDKEIHLMGFSQGGATAAIALSRGIVEERVSSVILDCAPSSTEDALRAVMGSMNIGVPLDYLVFSGNLYNRLALGFSYKDSSAADCLKESALPVLILSTKADEIFPFEMSEKLHEAASCSILAYVEDSAHMGMFRDYPEWYEQQVIRFLGGRYTARLTQDYTIECRGDSDEG